MDYSFVDFDYIETLELEIIAGRSFSRSFSTDSMAMVLNETAVANFGWTPEEAIGKQFPRGNRTHTVIGVLRDFNYRSLHSEVYALALFGPVRSQRYITARLADTVSPEVLRQVRETWGQFTDLPLAYGLLQDRLEAQYHAEQRLSDVFIAFFLSWLSSLLVLGCWA